MSVKQLFKDVLAVDRFAEGLNKCTVQTKDEIKVVMCKKLHILGKTSAHVTATDLDTFAIFEEGVKCDLSDETLTCWKEL